MLYKQFYSELGKLLYAVADIDGTISPSEKKALKDMVKKELVPAEKHLDEHGTDAAYYTEIEFDILEESITDPAEAFESFIGYVEDHRTAIDARLILIIRKVADVLANAFHHTNVRERALLARLNAKLDQLEKEN